MGGAREVLRVFPSLNMFFYNETGRCCRYPVTSRQVEGIQVPGSACELGLALEWCR